jgi:hypothetical protein
MIHAIVLGFGFSVGVFLWHFVVGFYAARAEQRRYRRGMELLYPKLTPVQPAPVQPPPAPPAPDTGVPNWLWVTAGAAVVAVGLLVVGAQPTAFPHRQNSTAALSGD